MEKRECIFFILQQSFTVTQNGLKFCHASTVGFYITTIMAASQGPGQVRALIKRGVGQMREHIQTQQ